MSDGNGQVSRRRSLYSDGHRRAVASSGAASGNGHANGNGRGHANGNGNGAGSAPARGRSPADAPELLRGTTVSWATPVPPLTVVVCTHERPQDLERCLAALARQTVRGLEVVVVDNAPRTGRTRAAAEAANVCYVVEPLPGLNRARNLGLRVARAPYVAYTDDDAIPDSDWAAVLLAVLAEPEIGGVAGNMEPAELETEAQRLFERYLGGEAGRRRRLERRRFAAPFPPASAGQVGAGANMAFPRAALCAVGGFDPAFDGGMPTRSAGDTEIFARLLAAGQRLVYEPRAVVAHRHRRTRRELRAQLFGYGVGVYAFWTHRVLRDRDVEAARFALSTLRMHAWRRLRRSLLGRTDELPPDLVMAELLGCLWGPVAYWQARREAGAPPSGALAGWWA
ncbi:MAG TPA: glycosyltransferase [Gemmatimonadaceae bacterium]|nr:glycosyltransferase [Gemmatimonadaceae bacterium]